MIVVSADSNSYETLIRANPPQKNVFNIPGGRRGGKRGGKGGGLGGGFPNIDPSQLL
jgi:hypothetical protein